MHLSSKRLGLISKVMGALVEPHSEKEIRQTLGDLVMDLMNAQFYASFVWNEKSQSFAQSVIRNMDEANVRNYERYYQFNDPITSTMQKHRVAVRTTDVMAQEGLVKTEFFNDFLARDGLYWGLNVYAWDGQNNLGDMRIWRDKRHDNFQAEDLQLMNMILPAFKAALLRANGHFGLAQTLALAKNTACLSRREWEVAELVARGCVDKDIARTLHISLPTVRTHISHVFRKLGVNNRSSLGHHLQVMKH